MIKRVCVTVKGCVQGVGFRPTVYRHATSFGIRGSVRNTPQGVLIDAQGEDDRLSAFIDHVQGAPPAQARIDSISLETRTVGALEDTFRIAASERSGDLAAGMPPDLSVCADCRTDILDRRNRHYAYPFTNCTNCGPRFTIIRELPYDRAKTSMVAFEMCPECLAEYEDPSDRRFDAQPNACPHCGPELSLHLPGKSPLAGQEALDAAVQMLREGRIGAVKGLGGFHFCCRADSEGVVAELRARKHRPHKPLAVMFASVEQLRDFGLVSPLALEALTSSAAPVVIVPRRADCSLPVSLSPDTHDIGVFLPYTPLHIMLLEQVSPLVMTSANRTEEPICSTFAEMEGFLGPVVDFVLDHNRDIVRKCDDSVIRIQGTTPVLIRRSRGFVPASVRLPSAGPSILACGAELKSTFCVTRGNEAFISQHIGDLTELPAYTFFSDAAKDMCRLLQVDPLLVACDLHPDYLATQFARREYPGKCVPVQHHHAHIAACMAENGCNGPAIGVAYDGTGYGTDGTIWGGEILITEFGSMQRFGRVELFRLPGGDEAVRDPVRVALSLLRLAYGVDAEQVASELFPKLDREKRTVLFRMIDQGMNSPLTSSMGRLFDGVSALCGCIDDSVSYEAQAAIRLQTAAQDMDLDACSEPYEFGLFRKNGLVELTLSEAIGCIVTDAQANVPKNVISQRFHEGLAQATLRLCDMARETTGLKTVALSGGVFQNDVLALRLSSLLRAVGYTVLTHNNVPCNDAGISYGQAVVASACQAAGSIPYG